MVGPDTTPLQASLSSMVISLMDKIAVVEVAFQSLSGDLESAIQSETALLDGKLQQVHQYVSHLTSRVSPLMAKCDIYDNRFAYINSVLTYLHYSIPTLGQSTTPSPNITSILDRLTALERRAPGHLDTDTSDLQEQVNMLEATLCDQSATIALLENSVVGAGVKMGDLVF
jgi:hypothetical protein